MKELLVFGEKTFKISVPDDSKITFGPWSPPREGRFGNEDGKRGTLRIYGKTKEDVLAVFAGVQGFRDLSLGYSEQVAKEEGDTIWKSDQDGYVRQSKVVSKNEWIESKALLPHPVTNGKGKKK